MGSYFKTKDIDATKKQSDSRSQGWFGQAKNQNDLNVARAFDDGQMILVRINIDSCTLTSPRIGGREHLARERQGQGETRYWSRGQPGLSRDRAPREGGYYNGVFAPNSKYRAKVTPVKRGKDKKSHPAEEGDQSPAEKRASMTRAKRLKRVFDINIA